MFQRSSKVTIAQIGVYSASSNYAGRSMIASESDSSAKHA